MQYSNLSNFFNYANPFFEVSLLQNVGTRKNQDDAFCVRIESDCLLVNVCDGIGSYSNGGESARMVCSELESKFEFGHMLNNVYFMEEATRLNDLLNRLESDTKQYGTTSVLVNIEGDLFRWWSIGDSKLWRWAARKISRLNRDETLAQEPCNGGHWEGGTDNSVLTNWLGKAGTFELANHSFDANLSNRNDIYIIASDGIGRLQDYHIGLVLEHYMYESTETILEKIVSILERENRSKESRDNLTLGVIKVLRPDQTRREKHLVEKPFDGDFDPYEFKF